MFLGFIATSKVAVEEGMHDGLIIAEFLARYFYVLVMPIYWLGSFIAEHTNWVNTTYWVTSLLLVSAVYQATILGLTEIIWSLIKKIES